MDRFIDERNQICYTNVALTNSHPNKHELGSEPKTDIRRHFPHSSLISVQVCSSALESSCCAFPLPPGCFCFVRSNSSEPFLYCEVELIDTRSLQSTLVDAHAILTSCYLFGRSVIWGCVSLCFAMPPSSSKRSDTSKCPPPKVPF